MIVWGSKGDYVWLGSGGLKKCPICNKETEHFIKLAYRWFHLYWMFGYVAEKKYFLLCDNCDNGYELNKATVESQIKKIPIPFMHRFGLASLGIVIALAIIVATINDFITPR